MMAFSKLVPMLSIFLFFTRAIANPCITDEDCSLNGLCVSSQCICDAGWIESDCGRLDLRPATRGTGYNLTDFTSPDHFSDRGNSSWGGNILRDPYDPELFHLFVDQFAHGCGLSAWRPTSYVVRAESRTGPQGPYFWAQDVTSRFRHNAYAYWSPFDEKWLLWTIGVTVPDVMSCKSVGKKNWPNNISVAAADDIRGPWSPFHITVNGTNPAPVPLYTGKNNTGAIALVAEDLNIYTAPSWNSSYTLLNNEPSWNTSDYSPTWTEDPFLWIDKRGNYHLLAHWMIDISESNGTRKYPRVGAHMFSRSLEGKWRFKVQEAFSSEVEFTDGSRVVFKRRERPKLWFSEDGEVTPLYLVSGVQEMNETSRSWTLVQPVGKGWKGG